ncbi:MAG: glycoside hydrolase family 92 protein [Balneolales bacterium]|nr:glycoside hydrolase family 92 protein [Balneolales bacterium]
MKKIPFLILALLMQLPLQAQVFSEYVDLFIGTAGDHGQLDPAATVPFGMVKLGPDTSPGNHSGYNYYAEEIRGFSHNRIGGVGCSGTGGNLRIFPGYGSYENIDRAFDKSSEVAVPGYYEVFFNNSVNVKLTSNNQSGFHSYTFPAQDSAFIEMDLHSSFARFIDAEYSIINSQELFVTVSARNVCNFGRYTVHYHLWSDSQLRLAEENNGKLIFIPDLDSEKTVSLIVTASSISEEAARDEWERTSSRISFDQAKERAANEWEEMLSKIEVEGKEEYKTLFYTMLYRIMLNPVKVSNSRGEFKSVDGSTYSSADYTQYASWSMWDNFRNKFSLLAILYPELSSDFGHSLADLFKKGKAFWAGYYEPVPTVRTEHTIVTLLDLYRRGITDFDLEAVYGAMSAEITNIHVDSPDTRLELSYDYWALSEIAGILGKEKEQALFLNQAMHYKRVWREKFLTINDRFDIMHGDGLYEGTLWQYRWHVQFDIPGIIEMVGSEELFTEQLAFFFDNDLYNHGNQPDLHAPFLFNYSGAPWLTQKWVNKILTKEMNQFYGTHTKWETPYVGKIYRAQPEGFIPEMDDDDGTMSAWYVLASMGMYPVLVGDATFQRSTPIFDKITIHLPDEKSFVIETKNFSDESFYIESTTLNGEPFNETYLTHDQITAGGKMVIETSVRPSKN